MHASLSTFTMFPHTFLHVEGLDLLPLALTVHVRTLHQLYK